MKYRRVVRLALTIALVTATLVVGSAAPAFAGTLTSTSFTAAGANAYTNMVNTSYDWAFTTATSHSLTAVSASVPAGTDVSNRYLALPGINGNYVSTPDTAANSITGDIDIRVKVALTDWTPSGYWEGIASKWTGGDRGWYFNVEAGGQINFMTSPDGNSFIASDSSANPTVSDGAPLWIRVTDDVDNGSGGNTVTFYTSNDGSSWTQLGSQVVHGGTTSIYDNAQSVIFGAGWGGSDSPVDGKIYYGEVRNGIGGTVVNKFSAGDPTPAQAAAGSWASTSPQAETWTVSRSGADRPADIAGDLTVVSTTGIPSTGTASYRYIDGAALYLMPSNPTVPASTPCTMSLRGFINTATTGNYTSLIKTWDSTPAVIDSATTAAQTFTAPGVGNVSLSATIDPALTFTVAGRASACNGVANTSGSSSSSSAVSLGHIGTVAGIASQDLTITTNAANGWAIYARYSGAMSDGLGHTIADVPSTSPAAFPASGTAAFGFMSGWWTTNTWQKVKTTDTMIEQSSAMSYSDCIAFQGQGAATTPAGLYSTTITYTAVPSF